MDVFLKFWGTRGSIPTPGSRTRIYGGNTSCVELRVGEDLFILDAGSGIRELGRDLLQRSTKAIRAHLFLTHTHWDHIQGFPFFAPVYLPQNEFLLYDIAEGDDRNHRLLSGQMSSSYFPVDFGELRGNITPSHLVDMELRLEHVTVRAFPLNHPGGCHGYLFQVGDLKIVYATDHETVPREGDVVPDVGNQGSLRTVDAELIKVFQGADLLIIDSQYTDLAYGKKRGWGHSSCISSTDLGIQSGVRQLALFHHDPESSDTQVDSMVESCRGRADHYQSPMTVFGAREGMELRFDKH